MGRHQHDIAELARWPSMNLVSAPRQLGQGE
jgi:hypothetical protein